MQQATRAEIDPRFPSGSRHGFQFVRTGASLDRTSAYETDGEKHGLACGREVRTSPSGGVPTGTRSRSGGAELRRDDARRVGERARKVSHR